MSCGVPWRLSAVLSMISRFKRLVHVALRPEHRPRRNAVDADLRSQLARQRARQHGESRLGRAVYRVRLEGPQPWISIMLMMSPCCLARLGAAACERNKGAFKLLPMRSSHCGSVI